MSRQSTKEALFIPYILMVLVAIAIVIVGFIFRPLMVTFTAIALIIIIVISAVLIKQALSKMDNHVGNLSGHISAGNNKAIKRMLIGLVVIDADDHIEWINQYMSEHLETNVISEPVSEVFPNILKQPERIQEIEIEYGQHHYCVRYSEEERCLYFFDITEEVYTNELYKESEPIIATLFLDDYDEVTQNMNDTQRSEINSMVTRIISRWATEYNIYFKRYSSDQFAAYLNQKILAEIEDPNFDILSQLREKSVGYRAQLTLSIGVGEGTEDLIELGELSQSGLDSTLGRGEDQVATRNMNDNVRFYGGKTDPMEKRTCVRARVISHALKDILTEGNKVIIMGHKRSGLDAVGAATGVPRSASVNNLEAYVVLNEEDIDPTLNRVMEEIDKKPELKERFVTSDEAWDMMTSKTTVAVVDTYKPEVVLDENILNKANRKVVIDHHRRGESFISNPLPVYMEPYASSTAELVTELLEYQLIEQRLSRLESAITYVGIIISTHNFTLRTGSRTFDAASYSRAHGADTISARQFLKDDVDTYINRSELIRIVEVQDNGVAIAHGSNDKIYRPIAVAQATDGLLGLEGIEASYVVVKREDSFIGILARSLGGVNVQLTIEVLGGGSHLTNVVTQIKGVTIEEAIEQLQQAVTEQVSRSEDT